jgi:hypothetical protein
VDGPGRWNDRIRAKLTPRPRTDEARAYLERWHVANRRLAEFSPGSSAHAALEAEIAALRDRYLEVVRAEKPADAGSAPDLDRAGGAA